MLPSIEVDVIEMHFKLPLMANGVAAISPLHPIRLATPTPTPVSDLALTWKITIVTRLLAVLGGSVASVADLIGGKL